MPSAIPRMFRGRRALATLLASAALLVGGGVGVAFAAGALTSNPATQTIQACEQTRWGLLNPQGSIRIVDNNQTDCNWGETPITWNVQGPKGDTGPAGPAGKDGTNGKDGAPGKDGADGASGKDGANGNTVLHGAGAPGLNTGVEGDFYLDTATTTLYGPKTADDWGAGTSLQGPAGPQGDPGPAGSGEAAFAGAPCTTYEGGAGTVSVDVDSSNNIALHCTVPVLDASILSLTPGEANIVDGTAVEFTLQNNGGPGAMVQGLDVAIDPPWVVSSNECDGRQLDSGASCTITVSLSLRPAGPTHGTLTVTGQGIVDGLQGTVTATASLQSDGTLN